MKNRLFAVFAALLLIALTLTTGLNSARADDSFNIVYTSLICDYATSTIIVTGHTTLLTVTDTYSEIYVNGAFIVEIDHPSSPPLSTLTFTIPLSAYVTLQKGDNVTVTNEFGTSAVSCGEGGTAAVNAWGVVNVRAVEWQFQAADGQWWWVLDSNSQPLQTPIEYRDVQQNGVTVPHYALSSLVITLGGAAPLDATKYRVYDADTHQMLHQIWIQIRDASVFIP